MRSAPVSRVQHECFGAATTLLVDLCARGDGTRAIVPEMMGLEDGRGLALRTRLAWVKGHAQATKDVSQWQGPLYVRVLILATWL